jgi:HEXXH motif-containing protein
VGPRHASIPAEWRSAPLEHLASDERRTMFADLRAYWTANGVLQAYLPDVAAWLGEVMRLCLPIRRRPDAKFKSASRADLPGVVFCDLGVSWSLILEGLVHETSHLRLFLEEHAGPLIPADHHATYRSPLRPEPRPLRGLLLAYHALAHMAALYRDLETAVPTAPISQDANTIRVKLAESRAVILAARGHLTPRGADFVERTERVCSHAL